MNLNEMSTPALAYLGDCVLELEVRKHLVEQGLSTSAHLNEAALGFVRASAQANAMKKILPVLSEEEAEYFRRGRNMGHGNVPRSATVAEYRAATGMETLFAALYLSGRAERIEELFTIGYFIES